MAFATHSDLATRLGVTFTAGEQAQATAILADVQAWLVSELGNQLIEAGSSVVTLQTDPTASRVRLPQWPVTAVNSVTVNGTAVTDYTLRDGHLHRAGGWPAASSSLFCEVVVDFDHGYDTVPGEIVLWTLVNAAGALAQIKRSQTMSAAGVQSERIDDYSVQYIPGSVAFEIPERQLNKLRAKYGGGAYVQASR